MNKITTTNINRKDGQAKVTGTATYAAEHQIPNLVHGYLITASIASGKIKSVNTQTAAKYPGVIAIFTHKNAPKISKPSNNFVNSKIFLKNLSI